MHQISKHLTGYDCYFSPYYGDGLIKYLSKKGMLDFTVLGGQFRQKTLNYLTENNLDIDEEGCRFDYDLVITCSDLLIPRNIRRKKIVLVQEGMTDPENFMFYLVKYLKLPRYFASTSTTGLSDKYDAFCVASHGYKKLFIGKGVKPEKIIVTGIPNFDNAARYLVNDFPYHNYVLAATSDARETFKFENRKRFIYNAIDIAGGRQLIFKLHPNENAERATEEINKYAPSAKIFSSGNTNHMIANSDVLVTKYSSVVYVGLALGKKVYSDFNLNELRKMMPIQNGGKSAENIAEVCVNIIEERAYSTRFLSYKFSQHTQAFAEPQLTGA